MTLQQFKQYLELEKAISERTSILYKNCVDLVDYNDKFYKLIKVLGEAAFTKEGWEHVSNFDEADVIKYNYSRENPMCWDGETKEPLYWDVDSLYEYLVKEGYIYIREKTNKSI